MHCPGKITPKQGGMKLTALPSLVQKLVTNLSPWKALQKWRPQSSNLALWPEMRANAPLAHRNLLDFGSCTVRCIAFLSPSNTDHSHRPAEKTRQKTMQKPWWAGCLTNCGRLCPNNIHQHKLPKPENENHFGRVPLLYVTYFCTEASWSH